MKWKNRKRIILMLVLLGIMCVMGACGKNVETIQTEFEAMQQGEITPQRLVSVEAYLDKYIGKLDRERASHMLVSYEDYALRFINTEVDKTLLEQMKGFYDENEKARQIARDSEVLKEFYEEMEQSKILMGLYEDEVKLSLDYETLANEYQKNLLPAVYYLYELKALEVEKPCIENAALLISWKQLAERAYRVELLMEEYKEEHLVAKDMKWFYDTYVNFMLMGANNTPVFDYSTMEFSSDAKKAYEDFIKEHPESTTAWILEKYFSCLDEMDYQLNYKNSEESKTFFNNCSWLLIEAEKRVKQ